MSVYAVIIPENEGPLHDKIRNTYRDHWDVRPGVILISTNSTIAGVTQDLGISAPSSNAMIVGLSSAGGTASPDLQRWLNQQTVQTP
jgi:hypothetical protein